MGRRRSPRGKATAARASQQEGWLWGGCGGEAATREGEVGSSLPERAMREVRHLVGKRRRHGEGHRREEGVSWGGQGRCGEAVAWEVSVGGERGKFFAA